MKPPGNDETETIHSLPPVVGGEPRVLILGSMPSAISLERNEYYANPRNHFWRLVAGVLGVELPVGYGEKVAMLKEHKIALWDSAATCVRSSSLDKDIKKETSNKIDAFLDQHPTIASVCFNGTKSQKIFLRHFKEREGKKYVLLPSSSPIPQRNIRTFEEKLAKWLILGELLGA